MNQHITTQCPQRSMAWLTMNEDEQIISVTKEMIQLLNYDPTNQYLDSVWKPIESDQTYLVVSTLQSLRTLCICTHVENNKRILICTDITDLNQMYSKRLHNISITRLTMYGTIEAAFKSPSLPLLAVGQPMMRYIHSDDVQLFCSALSKSGKNNTVNTLQVRILHHEDYQLSDFTVMTIEGGRKALCIIKPTHDITVKQEEHCYDNVLRETVTQMQSKIWYAMENGMNLVAHSIATSLMLVIQTVWQLWYNQDKTWSGLFSTSSEYIVRKLVKSTKQRPEIETLCRFMSWAGIQQSTTRSFIDSTLDETSDWLLSKTQLTGHGYDSVV